MLSRMYCVTGSFESVRWWNIGSSAVMTKSGTSKGSSSARWRGVTSVARGARQGERKDEK